MDLATRTHRRLLAIVAALVVLTVAGMVALWPASDALPSVERAPEALVSATITDVERYQGEADPIAGLSADAAVVTLDVTSGPDAGSTIQIDTPTEGYPDFGAGDEVKLSRSADGEGGTRYFIVDFERGSALMWLGALFVAAVIAVGRWHGARSLLGLGLSLLIVIRFIVPGIITGQSPALVALVGATAVMIVTLYLSHGVNEMTTVAVVGTTMALTVTIVLGLVFIDQGALTGYSSEDAQLARFAVDGLDLQGLVLAGLIIAALGVLDDVTVSQASTVFALHDADRRQGFGQLFGRAMTVGRDHIASTVNTLFLAYAGASLALLVVFSTGGLGFGEILTSEILAEEIIKTVVGSLGLIAAVPFTTALAATLAVRRPLDAPPLRGGHTHDHGPAPTGGRPTPTHADDTSDDDVSDDERAYRSWVRYLQEGTRGEGVPDAPGTRRTDDRDR